MSHQSIHAAQLAVMRDVPYLQKKKSDNGELKYTFAGEADLIAKVRPSMLEHGISVSPINAEPLVACQEYQTKSGSRMVNRLFRMTYRFAHVESGTHVDVVALGEASDTGDKAANKAMTIAMKYAIRQFFAIETGDDPDVVAHQRHAQNSNIVERAATAINRAKSAAELDELVEKFRNKTTGFDPAQLAELDMYVERQRARL